MFWRRSLAGWDAAFYALLAISAISIVTVADGYPPDGSTWAALGGLLVLLAWLVVGLVVGVRTFRWRRRDDG